MQKRILAHGVWVGLTLALCLGAAEAQVAEETTQPAAPTRDTADRTTASKPAIPVETPEAKVLRERVHAIGKVARDFSVKREEMFLNEARERDKKRREAEAEKKTRRTAPAELQTGSTKQDAASPSSEAVSQ